MLVRNGWLALLAVVGMSAHAQSTPYGGTAVAMPGRIEAEKYDLGGENVAYHDNDTVNTGGAFRTDGVDLVPCTDTACGQALSDVRNGEWLRYSVTNATTAAYTLNVRVASAIPGGLFHLEIDNVNVTGSITVPNTGSLSTWQTVTKDDVVLRSGSHVLKLVAESNGFSVNWLELVNAQTPYTPGIRTIASTGTSTIEAEAYDQGGSGIGWSDTTAGNSGGALRTDDVDIRSCPESAAGAYCVIVNGNGTYEWLDYSVSVSQAGFYTYELRTSGATLIATNLKLDGVAVAFSPSTPSTGSDSTFATTTVGKVYLPAGDHVLRLSFTSGSGNSQIDWIRFSAPQSPYGGTATAVPGKIELENYDVGGDNVSFHDSDTVNNGGVYRTDGVDLKNCTDAGCGTNKWVYNLASGEWLEYTIDVAYPMNALLSLRTTPQASGAGPSYGSMQVRFDNNTFPLTCDTSSAGSTPRVVQCGNYSLTAGKHRVRVSVGTLAPTDVDYLSIQPDSSAFAANTVPGKIEAEGYDNGGNGVGFSDTDNVNALNASPRYTNGTSDGVDMATSTDSPASGVTVGNFDDQEWMNYSVNATRAGPFDLKLRVASVSGASLQILVDGVIVAGSVTVPATGSYSTWQTITVSNLPMSAGAHQVKVKNFSGHLYLNWLQFDVTAANDAAPTVSLTAPANNASYTAPASVTLTATAADTDGTISKVEFYNGATLLGTATTSPYTYNWTSVAAGSYTLTAKAYDNTNVTTTSSAVAITVAAPNNPPTVSITVPAANAVFNVGSAISITASASDSDGTISKVEFYNGATLLGTVTSAPYTYVWNGATVGAPTLTAKAYDNLNAATTSAGVAITVNAYPTVSITAPANNAQYNQPASIAISTMAADSDGTISKVEFFNGATLIGTVTSAPFNYTWTGVAAGNYSLTAKATDNRGAATTSAAVTVVVNDQPPVTAITSPAANTVFNVGTPITITASASDSDGTISNVEFYSGATLIGTATSAPYTVTWNGAAAGTPTLTAKAYDNQNATTTSAGVAIVVNTPPTVSITAPAANASYTAPATITISANAADSDGTISKVEFYNGATLIGTVTTAPYTYTWTNVAAGTYTLTAKATDNRGAVVSSTTITVTVVTNHPPTVNLTAPTASDDLRPGTTVTLTANASDSDPDGSVTQVQFFNNGVLIPNATVTTGSNGSYSFRWTNVPAGSVDLTAVATDDKSATTTSAHISNWINQPPTATITAPANGSSATVGTAVTIAADATRTIPSPLISQVQFFDGATLIGSTAKDAPPPYTVSWTPSTTGSHTLTAKAIDGASKFGVSPGVLVNVVAANTPPTVTLDSPANNAVIQLPNAVHLSATATDDDGITSVVFLDGAGHSYPSTSTASPYTVDVTLAEGNYDFQAQATDGTGQVTTTASRHVTVNAPPAVSMAFIKDGQPYVEHFTSMSVYATASDSDGIAQVEFFSDGQSIGNGVINRALNAWVLDWQPTADIFGTHVLSARATDSLGAMSQSAGVTIVPQNDPPIVSLDAPSDNSIVQLPNPVHLSATATDVDGITSVVFLDGAGHSYPSTSTTSPYTVDLTLADDNYDFRAQATDGSGLVTTTASVHVRVNAGPTGGIATPIDGNVYNYPLAYINLRADFSDSDGITGVDFFDQGAPIGSGTLANSSYFLHWDTSALKGRHVLTAKAKDGKNGETTSTPVTMFINQAPTVALIQPTSGTSVLSTQPIALSASASDPDAPDGSVASVTYTISNATATRTETATQAPFATVFDPTTETPLPAGTYTVTAVATDDRGRASAVSAGTTLQVRAATAATVSLAVQGAVGDGFLFAGDVPQLSATLSDPDGFLGLSGVTMEFFSGCAGQSQTSIGSATAPPYVASAPASVGVGTHCYSVRATSVAMPTRSISSAIQTFNVAANKAPSAIVITKPTMPSSLLVNGAKVAGRTTLYADSPSAVLNLEAKVTDDEGNLDSVQFNAWVLDVDAQGAASKQRIYLGFVKRGQPGQTQFSLTVDLKNKLGQSFPHGSKWPILISALGMDTRGQYRETVDGGIPQEDGIDQCGAGTLLQPCTNRSVPISYIESSSVAAVCGTDSPASCSTTVKELQIGGTLVLQGERVDKGGQDVAGFTTYQQDTQNLVLGNSGLQPIRGGIDTIDVACPFGTADQASADKCYLNNVRDGDRFRYSLKLRDTATVSVKARVWIPAPKTVINPMSTAITLSKNGSVTIPIQVTGAYFGQFGREEGTISFSEFTVSVFAVTSSGGEVQVGAISNWQEYYPNSPQTFVTVTGNALSSLPLGTVSLVARTNARIRIYKNIDPFPSRVEYIIYGPSSPVAKFQLTDNPVAPVAASDVAPDSNTVVDDLPVVEPLGVDFAGAQPVLNSPATCSHQWTADGVVDASSFVPEDKAGHWFTLDLCDYDLPAGNYQMNWEWPFLNNGMKVDYFELTATAQGSGGKTVSITAPLSNARYVSGTSTGPAVSVTTEVSGVVDTSAAPSNSVKYFVDTNSTADATSAIIGGRAVGNLTLPVNVSGAPVAHTIRAELWEGSTKVATFPATAGSYQLIVDTAGTNVAPTVVITSPSTMNPQGTPQFAPNSAVQLRATVTDPNAGDTISNLRFEVTPAGGSTTTVAAVLSAGVMSATWTPTNSGVYAIVAKANDGKVDGVSAAINVSIGETSFTLEQAVEHVSASNTHDPTVGMVDGKGDTQGGVASYSIPIVVPPGRAGMQPSLSLNYSSKAGNGIAGMGWSLSASSSISRCPQTVEQDGQARPVTYSSQDRFCLDGQRLIAVGAGNYDAAGQEYRTEIESFSRIRLYRSGTSQQAMCFSVEEKTGEIAWYGGLNANCDSATVSIVRSTTGGPTHSWLLEKREDRSGNEILYTYHDYGYSEVLLTQIEYTGFKGLVGNRKVVIEYNDRPTGAGSNDVSSSYVAGMYSMKTQRLVAISTYAPTNADAATPVIAPVKRYELSYGAPGQVSSISGRSLLRGIRECAFDVNDTQGAHAICRAPTTFEWQDTVPAPEFKLRRLNVDTLAQPAAMSLPVSWDSRTEKYVMPEGFWDSALAPGGMGSIVKSVQGGLQQRDLQQRGPLAGTSSTLTEDSPPVLSAFNIIGDIDGDGTQEAIARLGTLNPNGSYTYSHVLVRMRPDRSIAGWIQGGQIAPGFALHANNGTTGPIDDAYTFFGDVNNDGRTDIVGNVDGYLAFAFFNGTWSAPTDTDPGLAGNFYVNKTSIPLGTDLFLADFNGDGKLDVLQRSAGADTAKCDSTHSSLSIYLNTSASGDPHDLSFSSGVKIDCLTFKTVLDGAPGIYDNLRQRVARIGDFDGNGVPDIWIRRTVYYGLSVLTSRDEPELVYMLSLNGAATPAASVAFTSTKVPVTSLNSPDAPAITMEELGIAEPTSTSTPYSFWMDVNGDGREDLVSGGLIVRGSAELRPWQIRLNKGGRLSAPISTGSIAGFPTPTSAPHYSQDMILGPISPLDVDSDGKTELLIPKAFAMRMCTMHHGSINSTCDNDAEAGCSFYLCPEDPVTGARIDGEVTVAPLNGTAVPAYPARPMYAKGGAGFNGSIYKMGALRFVQTGATSFRVDEIPYTQLGITSSSSATTASTPGDLFGDGMTDMLQPISCPFGPRIDNATPMCGVLNDGVLGPSTLPDCDPGAACTPTPTATFVDPNVRLMYVSENQGAGARASGLPVKLPDLMSAVVEGAGTFDVRTEWDYFPLSSTAGRPTNASLPLYTVPARTGNASGYIDERHFYFNSSMPVVATMRESNGVGGLTEKRFGYEEAMFNNRGRGFQGFRTITTDSMVPGMETRSRTVFHQRFPLSSKPETIEINAIDANETKLGLVKRETFDWRCFKTVDAGNPQRTASSVCPGSMTPTIAPQMGTSWFVFTDKSDSTTYDQSEAVNGRSVALSATETLNANEDSDTESGYDKYGNARVARITTSDLVVPADFDTQVMRTTRTVTPDPSEWWLDRVSSEEVTTSISWSNSHSPPAGVDRSSKKARLDYHWSDDHRHLLLSTDSQAGLPDEAKTVSGLFNDFGMPRSVTTSSDSFGTGAARDRTTTIAYSADGYFQEVLTNPMSHYSRAQVRPRDGLTDFSTDAVGNSVGTVYDAFGYPINTSVWDSAHRDLVPPAEMAVSRCAGNCPGGAVTVASRAQDGSPVTYTYYDQLGREIQRRTTLPNGELSAVDTNFDAAGRPYQTSMPHRITDAPLWKTQTFDHFGRTTSKVNPQGTADVPAQKRLYKYVGRRMIARIEPRDSSLTIDQACTADLKNTCITVSRDSDASGKMVRTVDALGNTSRYWHDSLGHETAIEGVDHALTTATYNASGHRVAMTDADMGSWTFVNDATGALKSSTDARGVVVTNVYDALGRLVERNTSATPSANKLSLAPNEASEDITDSWIYDIRGKGLLASASRRLSASGLIWNQESYYDDSFRPSRTVTSMQGEATPWEERVNYHSYYGWVRSRVLPSGLEVHTRYSKYGHPITETNGTTDWSTAIQWDAAGATTRVVLGNGLVETAELDPGTGQVKNHAVGNSPTDPLDLWTYTYDALGNVVTVTRVNAGQSINSTDRMTYDAHQRITSASVSLRVGTGPSVQYGYFANGNPKYKSDYSQYLASYDTTDTGAYTYGTGNTSSLTDAGPHAVTSVTLAGGTSSENYTYDNNGNLIGGSTISARYDHANLPWYVSRNVSKWDRFKYDPYGRRFYHLDSSGRTTYYSDSGYEKTRGQGDSSFEFRHHLGSVIVEWDTAFSDGRPKTTYVHMNRQGSTIALSSSSGLIDPQSLRAYDPFGGVRNGDFSTRSFGTLQLLPTQNRGYTGHEHLDETYLIHMNGRTYDYRLGRFLAVDPVIQMPENSQGLNPYSYILNNPFSGTDPSGYVISCDEAANKCSGTASDLREATYNPDTGHFEFKSSDGKYVFDVTSVTLSNGVKLDLSNPEANKAVASALIGAMAQSDKYRTSFSGTDKVQATINNSAKEIFGGWLATNGKAAFCTLLAEVCGGAAIGREYKALSEGRYEDAVHEGIDAVLTLVGGGTGRSAAKQARVAEEASAGERAGARASRERPEAPSGGKGSKGTKCHACFIAGTTVLTASGERPIEQIAVGDLVLSVDTNTGVVTSERVLNTFHYAPMAIYDVTIFDRDSASYSSIEVTSDHPFFVKRLGWVPVSMLETGDQVETFGGGDAYVVSVHDSLRYAPTFNLEVETNHDFFVGSRAVLVHNSAGDCPISGSTVPVKGEHVERVDTTLPNSVKNYDIRMNRGQFESNLKEAGWSSKPSRDGVVTIWEKDGARYVTRDVAKTRPGTPSVDYYPPGSKEYTIKYRLVGGSP